MQPKLDQALIDEIEARTWHHRIDFGNGIVSASSRDVRRKIDRMELGERIPGSAVLDVGTRDGGLAFEFERRGAKLVIANDFQAIDQFNFELARRCLGSRVAYLRASLYCLPFYEIPRFDIVSFCGVIYHISDPVLSLWAMRHLCKPEGVIIVESAVQSDPGSDAPESNFEYQEYEEGNSWIPTTVALERLCRDAGFEILSNQIHGQEDSARQTLTCRLSGVPRFHSLYRMEPLKSLFRSLKPKFE